MSGTRIIWDQLLVLLARVYGLNINNKNIKLWNETYAKVPNNHILLNDVETILDIPFYLDLDIVLTHERFMQYDFGVQIAKYFHLPMVCLEHICMTPQRESLKK